MGKSTWDIEHILPRGEEEGVTVLIAAKEYLLLQQQLKKDLCVPLLTERTRYNSS